MTRQSKFVSFIKEWGVWSLCMLLIILSRLLIWAPVTVQGHSMDPTLQDKEKLIMVRHTSVQRFDIVVAEESKADGSKTQVVKRVIGMPGDTIAYKNDVLTVNGEETDEPYLKEYLQTFRKDKLQATYSYDSYFQELARRSPSFTTDSNYQSEFSITVPEGEYFLIGDDRIVSKDSRHVGSFTKANIIGEIKFRWWPLNHLDFF